MTEGRMKNLFRMQIHPNQMGAIRASEVKQLFVYAKPRRLEFWVSKRPFLFFYLDLIYFIHCTAVLWSFFYYKLAEVPGVARGILKMELKQKLIIYLAYFIPRYQFNFLTKIQPIWFSRLASHSKHKWMKSFIHMAIDYNFTSIFFSKHKLLQVIIIFWTFVLFFIS